MPLETKASGTSMICQPPLGPWIFMSSPPMLPWWCRTKVGNEIVRVKNRPEDYLPGMLEKFEARDLQQKKETGAKSKRQSKDRDADDRSTTPRRSSRTKKPTEYYQAGLNSMQASSNPRGYVDSSSRYRSYSRDRLPAWSS
jgi:hypothetical protein